ncbi:DUF2190 family protein [Pendulispora brunnea]|uniref:DUF2190 family protein n=1 Tax=Pendulispora brunnea TaxID=2905690 RepID=A0ABZ2KDU2_9BACT
MAITSQIGGFPVEGGDLPFRNYGTNDIASNIAVLIDANPANIMGVTVPQTDAPVTRGIGITLERIPAGKTGRVRCIGAAVATASAAITAGDPVQIDSAVFQEGHVKLAAAGAPKIGIALTTAGALDAVCVLLTHAP